MSHNHPRLELLVCSYMHITLFLMVVLFCSFDLLFRFHFNLYHIIRNHINVIPLVTIIMIHDVHAVVSLHASGGWELVCGFKHNQQSEHGFFHIRC